MDIWVVQKQKFLCEYIFLSLSNIYLGMELLAHLVIVHGFIDNQNLVIELRENVLYVFRATSSVLQSRRLRPREQVEKRPRQRHIGFPLSMDWKPISLYSGALYVVPPFFPQKGGREMGLLSERSLAISGFAQGALPVRYTQMQFAVFITYVSVIIWIRSCFSSSVHSYTSSRMIFLGQKSGHAACFLSVLQVLQDKVQPLVESARVLLTSLRSPAISLPTPCSLSCVMFISISMPLNLLSGMPFPPLSL